MKLCVIYEERTLFVRHIGFSVVKKKAAYHRRAQMSVISGHGIINIFKILIEFGWFFSDKGALPGGPF